MTKVEIDDETIEKLKIRAQDKGFGSVEEYIETVLKQIAKKVEKKHSGKDEEKVKDRLRSLGYMD